jgi:hypothetical protein
MKVDLTRNQTLIKNNNKRKRKKQTAITEGVREVKCSDQLVAEQNQLSRLYLDLKN